MPRQKKWKKVKKGSEGRKGSNSRLTTSSHTLWRLFLSGLNG